MSRGAGRCLCRGATGDGAHAIWVGFLDSDNHQYEGEQCGWDYMCVSSDALTFAATWSWKKHCQLLFWDDARQASVTVDVNETRGKVFEAPMKEFTRHGWTFVRLRVSEAEERRALAFLRAQLDKPMNTSTSWFACGGAHSGEGKRYFCSELVVSTLHALGYARDVRAASMSPGSLYAFLLAGGASVARLRPRADPHHVVRHRRFWTDYERETDELARVQRPDLRRGRA